MKAARFAGVATISEKVVCVIPGSLKSNPPIAIHVWRVLDFKAVNSEYKITSSWLCGTTANEAGSIDANAKLRCVNPLVFI